MLDEDYISENDRLNIREVHAEYLCGETIDHEDIDWGNDELPVDDIE